MWPSALSGKLGDVAWLFFIPLAAVALLSLLTSPNAPRVRQIIPLLAYGSVGLIFTIAKTLPPAHELVVSVASRMFGFQVGWRLDPTDLIALPALGASAWLWLKTPEPALRPRSVRPGAGGWIALAAAMLLTVANSPAPDPGIYCLDEREGEVEAFSGYSTYRSTDGGLTWQSLPNQLRGACPNPWSGSTGTVLTSANPSDERYQYRATPGQSIELSEDGGLTWRVIYEVPTLSEASLAATRRRLSSYAMVRPVPLDVKVDRATGNAVFAMGHSGALVYEATKGTWREAVVGPYRPVDVNAFSDFLGLLVGEILLAVGIALLGFATISTRLLVRGRGLWIFVLVLAWSIWTAIVFVVPPALTYGYESLLTYGAMLVLGVILLILTVIALVGSLQHARGDLRRELGRPLISAVLAGILFLLPYALWATGTLPSYRLAGAFGTLLGVAAVMAGARWTGRTQERFA
jgi:hypothetical protein